jgi:hypothetical protein
MAKAAFVVYAGTDAPADAGRVLNAMVATQEFLAAGDDALLVLDGAGTEWLPVLESPDYEYHDLYTDVREVVAVCAYCARAQGVGDVAESAPVDVLAGNGGHPSIHSLVDNEYEIITF